MGTTRAAPLTGAFQKVTLGATSKILGGGKYTISGAIRKTVETSEFTDDVDVYEFTIGNGGTISLDDVTFDPTDPEQNTLRTAVTTAGGVKLINSTTSGIRFWLNSTSYMTVGTSGTILLTDAGAVSADRNGVAKTSFKGQVSGAFMIIV
jgi:hypothetical protein